MSGDSSDFQNENELLRASLKDLQRSFSDFTALKTKEIKGLKSTINELNATVDTLTRQIEVLEEETASSQKHIRVLQKALKTNLSNLVEAEDEQLPSLDSVKDPQALLIINKLLRSDRKLRNSVASNAEPRVDALQTQNAFLLSQVSFLEKKLEQSTEEELRALCRILGVRDRSQLVEAATKVQQVCRQIPPLQSTLQDIHALVAENNIIPVNCGSLADLVEILENWAGNLRDYHQLVQELFDILRVTEDKNKNRSFLLESIRRLSGRGGSAAEVFVGEARKRLRMSAEATEQAIMAKALRVLEERASVGSLRMSSASNSVLPSGDER